MPNLNKVMLMGNLTRDPELRYTPSNNAVVKIGLAINRRWRDQQSGEQREETTFVDCEAWGRTAETINQYLRKGRPIFIEGRLKLDQWQDKESGGNRSKLLVVVETFQFVDSKADGGGEGGGGPPSGGGAASRPRPAAGSRGSAPQPAGPPSEDPHQAMPEEDIPF